MVGILAGVLIGLGWARMWLGDMRQLIDLVRIARDEEREGRIRAERQRDELLAKYAATAVQVISALPVATAEPGVPRVPHPGGDPDATVAA
jgi:hypothetical protein